MPDDGLTGFRQLVDVQDEVQVERAEHHDPAVRPAQYAPLMTK